MISISSQEMIENPSSAALNVIPEEMEREEMKVSSLDLRTVGLSPGTQTLTVPVTRRGSASPYHRLRRASHHVISQVRSSSLDTDHQTDSFSLLYCSLFMFLLVSFVLGLILVGVGMVSFPHCKVKYPSRGDSQAVRTGQSLASVAQYPGTHRLFSLPHPLLWRD